MEEIKEEYVRLIGGIIYKARCKDTRSGIYIIPHQYIVNGDGKIEHQHIHSQYITKHSPNIIDLIEKGDFVNGFLVDRKDRGVVVVLDYFDTKRGIEPKDIKTILTKEQYQANCYEVK